MTILRLSRAAFWNRSILTLYLCVPSAAWGEIPAVIVDGTPTTSRARDWMVGFEFSVPRDLTITELGRFDTNGNGLLDNIGTSLVGLWDNATGELLRSVGIDPATSVDGGAFYAPIEPLQLAPGNYVIAAQSFADQEPITFLQGEMRLIGGMERIAGRFETANDFVLPPRRTSSVMVAPTFKVDQALIVNQPTPWSVIQRNDQNQGTFPIQGLLAEAADRVQARLVAADGSPGAWQMLQLNGAEFAGSLIAPAGGWYALEVRASQGANALVSSFVDNLGVGDVYVTAGQSNSANHGSPRQQTQTGLVAAMDANGRWALGNDPQPIATGTDGSPWPLLGDILARESGIPIGFVSVGWGGTRVDQWLPGGDLYPRLRDALERLGPHGAKAVLWHQGESDAANSTTAEEYASRLQQVIAQSRQDAGYDIPWGVALASYLPPANSTVEQQQAVLNGQAAVIAADPLVFPGPLTDDLLGREWRYDDVHFNQQGLAEHARRWAAAVDTYFVPEPAGSPIEMLWLGAAALAVTRRHGILPA